MRWLLALVLVGCGDEAPCYDAPPLSGIQSTCSRIDGTWRLQPTDERLRCGASLLSNPVKISSRGSELNGSVGGRRITGVNYASGAFELEAVSGQFSLRGELSEVDGVAELSGGVVFGGAGQTCDALWDFIAHRQ